MNKVIMLGRLTKDPELKFAAGSGTAVTRFSIAVKRPFKKDETDFINCVAFGKTAEAITQYIKKGQRILISDGHIQTGSYDAQDGTKRYTTDVICQKFEFVESNSTVNSDQTQSNEGTNFGGAGFNEDITPIDDGDMPF